MSKVKNKLVYGIGVNDVDFYVSYMDENGTQRDIKSYRSWKAMIGRCYHERIKLLAPAYRDCTTCDEWIYFSSYFKWYERQYKEDGWCLDKDLLIKGNKLYHPDRCVFIPYSLNLFLTDSKRSRGNYMIGVTYEKNRYRSQCSNPFTGRSEKLGSYMSEIDAHIAWRKRKHELACQWADMVNNQRVSAALRTRYADDIA